MKHRNNFVNLIDNLDLESVVEIGVAEGDFARVLLTSKIKKYYGIDPWASPAAELHKAKAFELLQDERVHLIEETSKDASLQFTENSVDFVYLDTTHDYESTLADLHRWWPKTRCILAGHDYGLWNHAVNLPLGVIPAVERFAQDVDLSVYVTGAVGPTVADRLSAAYNALHVNAGYQGHNIPSFYIYKK